MKKYMTIMALMAIILAISVSIAFAGEEFRLKKFTVSPSPFAKGQTLRISVELENPTTRTVSGAGNVNFFVTDGTPERRGRGAFLGSAPIPTVAPRSTVTINLAQTYTVPHNAGDVISFSVVVPQIPPVAVEFGATTYRFEYRAVCRYHPPIRIPEGVRLPIEPIGPLPPLSP